MDENMATRIWTNVVRCVNDIHQALKHWIEILKTAARLRSKSFTNWETTRLTQIFQISIASILPRRNLHAHELKCNQWRYYKFIHRRVGNQIANRQQGRSNSVWFKFPLELCLSCKTEATGKLSWQKFRNLPREVRLASPFNIEKHKQIYKKVLPLPSLEQHQIKTTQFNRRIYTLYGYHFGNLQERESNVSMQRRYSQENHDSRVI